DAVLGGGQTGLQRVVAVDDGCVDVRQRARQLRGVGLDELEVLRVVRDVVDRRGDGVRAVGQADHARLSQQIERAALVGGIVVDADRRAVRQVLDARERLRVQGERLDVDA